MREIRILLGALLLLGCTSGGAGAQPPAPAVSYAAYDKLLKTYVNGDGMVDYAAWKKKDEATLRKQVQAFAAVDASKLTGDAKKAYWINVYNAVVLQAMLEYWPVKSILKVKQGGKAFDVFKQYPFGPKRLTLDHIENQILRKLGDPRIHAAIVCASKGCPPLRDRAYLPKNLDAQLDANVETWFKSPTRGLKLVGDTAYVSQIFNWFGGDFAKTPQGRLRWIAKHVDAKTAKRLRSGELTVKYIDWNWAANAQ